MMNTDLPPTIRCLAFRSDKGEDNKWSAVALEMDVWAFANTRHAAMKELKELIATQVEFATSRNEPEILNHPTDSKWFRLWNNPNQPGKEAIVLPRPPGRKNTRHQWHKAA